jgi:sortase A
MTSFAATGPHVRESRFIRLFSVLFILTGVVALSYIAYFYGSAYLFQEFEPFHFESDSFHLAPSNLPAVPAVLGRTVAEGSIIGRIEIGRLGLSAIVIEGDASSSLRRGVGHVPNTALPGEFGNMALTAHRDTFFRGLRNIQQGDLITLETLAGEYQYEVDSTSIVSPTSTEVLKSSADQELTLITCYPFYFVGPAPKRFVVHARKLNF